MLLARVVVLLASHSFWGWRYPQLFGPHCNDVIEKIKNHSVKNGLKSIKTFFLPHTFISWLVLLLAKGH
jgi:hypothetical protein